MQQDYLATAEQAERLAEDIEPGIDRDQMKAYAERLRSRARMEARSFAPPDKGWDPATGD